jgi:hypothetical protein
MMMMMINDEPDAADDLDYSRALVHAALTLPVRALPMAHACLEALDLGAMPSVSQAALMHLLRRMGNCAPSPASAMLRAALHASAQPGAPWDAAQRSAEWVMLKAFDQDAYALAALAFMREIATANVQRLERAQALSHERVQRAQAAVDALEHAAA